jgi:hypothetical protein
MPADFFLSCVGPGGKRIFFPLVAGEAESYKPEIIEKASEFLLPGGG